MKGPSAVALAIAIALPVCAQHGGGGHASGGGHAGSASGMSGARPAPGFHGGFAPSHGFAPSAPVHYGYGGNNLGHAPVSYPSSIRLVQPGVRYPVRAPLVHPSFYHPGHQGTTSHSFYIHTYPAYPYAYPYTYPSYVYGYLPSDLLDDSYDNYGQQQLGPEYGSAYSEPTPQPDNGYGYPQPGPQPDYGSQQPDYGTPYPQPMPTYPQPVPEGAYAYPVPQGYPVPPGYQPYPPQPMPAAPQMQYVPGSASTVILIYKDGRPPEQIQNYLATRSTLTVLDGGRRREIPLSELNLPATVSANRQTGVDFKLPSATPEY